MEVQSDWYDRIAKQISLYKDSLNKKEYAERLQYFLSRIPYKLLKILRLQFFSCGHGSPPG